MQELTPELYAAHASTFPHYLSGSTSNSLEQICSKAVAEPRLHELLYICLSEPVTSLFLRRCALYLLLLKAAPLSLCGHRAVSL